MTTAPQDQTGPTCPLSDIDAVRAVYGARYPADAPPAALAFDDVLQCWPLAEYRALALAAIAADRARLREAIVQDGGDSMARTIFDRACAAVDAAAREAGR